MSTQIATYFEQAQLAMAAYALNLISGITDNKYKAALRGPNEDKMAKAQAEWFVNHYDVIDSQQSTISGFSATLFRDKATGEYTLAMRGTEFDGDTNAMLSDLISADIGGIAIQGVAAKQIVDMYNYYQRLVTPAGHYAPQFAIVEPVVELIADQTPNVIYSGGLRLVDSKPGLGALSPTDTINLSGHSLGGHLAAAFSRLVPGATQAVYEFNGAGFYTGDLATSRVGVNTFFDTLAGYPTTFDSGKISNIYGTGGPEIITNAWWHTQYGKRTPAYIEAQDPTLVGDHSISLIADSLALYDLFARLDPGLDIGQIDALLRGASNQMNNTLEKTLQALTKLFLNSDATIGIDDRNAFYNALIPLRGFVGEATDATTQVNGTAFVVAPLVGISASSLAGLAALDTPTGMAYRYALQELNPFAVVTQANLYDQHNANGELDLYDPQTGDGDLTEQYLVDRTKLLSEINQANVDDNSPASGVIQIAGDVLCQDKHSGYKIVGNDLFVSEHKKVLFGDDQADSFSGGGKADHLYGGAGDDTLHGAGGDDYLEGGTGKDELFGDDGSDALYGMADDDKLDGGAGIDVLHGGIGNDDLKGGDDLDVLYGGGDDDTLDGGLGNDLLYGGNGTDTYKYKTGEGHDTITDIDGLGSITFDGKTLTGGTKIGDGVYQSEDKKFTYLVVGDPSIGATIEVNGTLTIENYKTGTLGLTLGEQTDAPAPLPHPSSPDAWTEFDDLWGLPPIPSGGIGVAWTRYAGVQTTAYGLGGNDVMVGADGAGYLDGGIGDDYIFLGNGPKTGIGGDGNDIVTAVQRMTVLPGDSNSDTGSVFFSGGHFNFSNRNIIEGIANRAPVDTLGFEVKPNLGDTLGAHFGPTSPIRLSFSTLRLVGNTFSQIFDSGSAIGEMKIHGGAGNDGLFGGNQNDMIFGEADDDGIAGNGGDDILLGGDGNDTILGGYGNDLIDAGADQDIVYGEYGDDTISGGSGDDALHGDSDVSHTKWELHGNDIIDGGAGNDSLFGEGGDDFLRGGDGNDKLRGDGDLVPIAYQGNDYLDGGAGNDELQGFRGDDRLFGGTGDDVLAGNEGNDYLEGNDGADQLLGGDGDDQLIGGVGDDLLQGEDGTDTLSGSDGRDVLDGGAGNDILAGGNDDDQLQGGDGNDLLDGGQGDDSVLGQGGDDTIEGGAGNDSMVGNDGNDHLSGGTGDDALRGDAGNDVLDGGSGNNYLDGGDGNDTLISNGSNDQLVGGAGDDTYVIGSGNVFIDDSSGRNILVMSNVANAASLTFASVQDGNTTSLGLTGGGGVVFGIDNSAIDTLRFADGSSVAYRALAALQNHILTGNDNDGYVKGGKNTNDTIRGKKGNDLLIGGSGKDTFLFDVGDGKDVLSEDADGNVTLKFGPGVSAIQINSKNACAIADDLVLSYGNQGDSILIKRGKKGVINKIEYADGTVVTATEIAKQFGIGNADLKSTDSNDLINGTAEDDHILSGGGDDVLVGSAGNDWLDGENGNDSLSGGVGNDTLMGGEGDDYLAGGAGNDSLVGSFGADTVFFARGDGHDLIRWDNGNSQDTLQFGPGITQNDLEFRRLANHDLEIVLRNTDDKITLGNWISADADSKLTQVRFDDGLTFNLTSLPNLPVTPVVGTDSNDVMTGTRWVDDVFAGGAGDDVLQGKQGNDILDGGGGNDTLIGEQGNDQLSGGTGTDSYILSLNMGTDTVVEVAGETSKLMLTDNIAASDLYFETRGKDLFVGTRGIAERAVNGVVIKNYTEQNHTWIVEDSNGVQSNLSILRAEHDASISALAGSNTNSLIDHARSEFLSRARIDIYTSWRGDQDRDIQPNIRESRLLDDRTFSFERSRHGFYTYDQQGFLSGNEGQSESIAFNFFGAPGNDFYNAYTRQVTLIQSTSDAADITRSSEDVSIVSQSTTQVGVDFQGTTGTATHNEYLDQARPVPNATREKAFVREETIDDSIAISGHVTDVIENPASGYVTLTQAAKAMFDTGTLPAKFLLTRNFYDTTTNIENLKAGASDNNIDISGYAMIDGGAGDDIVNQYGSSNRSFIDLDNPVNSPEFAPGQFIYGNDGNDKLWGRQYSDVIIGGNGNDFLNGAGGTDTYYVLPDATGIDVIYDSGTPFSYDGWNEVYANWYYQNQGYANWRELQYSGTLPALPEFPVNDYQALDPWVRAGIFGRDTVEFAPGLALADLHFAWGQANVVSTDGSVTAMNSLDITWGVNKGVQVVIPTEGAGTGIELFKFADGSLYTMADILRYAPPAPQGYLASHDGTGNDNVEPFVANPIAMQTTEESLPFAFAIPADAFADPNVDDVLTYTVSLDNGDPLPTWLTYDADTRTLSGNPDDPQVGTISIRVNATDAGGLSASTTFDLTVTNVNDAPIIAQALADQIATQDQAFSFVVPSTSFTDADGGDTMTLNATLSNGNALPTWLTFNAVTRTFSGIPANGDVGNLAVKITATDVAGAAASSAFALSIANVNDAPIVADPIAAQTTNEDQAFSLVLPASIFSDPDVGDSLTYGVSLSNGAPLPSWLSYDAATRMLSGTPGNSEVGIVNLKVTATDQGGLSAATVFSVNVANVNDVPVVAQAVASQSTTQGGNFSFVVPTATFTDIDAGDVLTLSAVRGDGSALPSWITFNTTTKTFQGTPSNGDVGAVQIKLTATDTAGASATTLFVLNVANVNDVPVVSMALADQTVVEYKPLTFTIPANTFADIDKGDSLAITASLDTGAALPDWLTFDPDTLTFSGTPSTLDLGTLQVRVIATDTGGLSTSDIFALTVNAAPGQKLTGGSGNDTLTGASGNDTLSGGLGADTLSGGTGNDTYIVDNAGDVVIEKVNEGTDTVQSSITYTLGANVENLKLTGTAALNGTGNDLNNTLTGNGAANTLNGGAGNDNINGGVGADTLIGGLGNDTLTVDNIGDVVVENANEGTDRVNTYITYTLGANVENLTLLGTTAIDGTGNTLDNSMTGNGANNRLAGGDGNDTLSGGAGNDTLLGQAGDDTLTGGTGADALLGGAGNDIYVITDNQDTVTELANEGVDRVNSSISYTLGDNIENLTLTGTAETYGIGNSLDNTLAGNNSANYLAGLAGNDTIRGNGANDILQSGDGNDTITDNGGQNLLDGGAGTDTLTGNAGNEIFIGGQGNDTITTGTGADIVAFNKGDGQDIVKASVGSDNTLSLGGGIQYNDLQFRKVSNNLILDTGAGESIIFQNWYVTTANNKSVVTLQMIEEAAADFSAAGSDPLRNNKIETFNFAGLVSKFDQAKAATPTLTSWSLTNALLDFHTADSDTAALGGDLAYQYGKNGNLANVSLTPAHGILGSSQFGATPQALQPLAGLQDSSVRLT